MDKKLKKLEISYYETSWEYVCMQLVDKINELIDVVNSLQKSRNTQVKTFISGLSDKKEEGK